MALMMSTIEIGIETGESARDRPLPCILSSSTHPSHLCKQKSVLQMTTVDVGVIQAVLSASHCMLCNREALDACPCEGICQIALPHPCLLVTCSLIFHYVWVDSGRHRSSRRSRSRSRDRDGKRSRHADDRADGSRRRR